MFIALIACLVLSATLFSACGDKNKDKKEAVSITLSAAPRQYYAPGESIDLTGGEISVSFSDGSTSKFSLSDSAVSVSHFGTNAKNRVEYMTVTYGGKSLKIPYYVNSGTATQIVGVELEKGNMFTTYSVGGTFAYGTSYFKVLYSNGKYSSYPLSSESTRNGYNFSFSGFDSKTVGENKKAVFTFYATTFEIEYDIVDYVFAMNILMDNNIGNVYMLGDQIELNDSMFSVVCSDGSCKATMSRIFYDYNDQQTEENFSRIPAEQQITDQYALRKNGTKLVRGTGTKFRVFTVDLKNRLFDAIQAAVR